MRGPLTAERRQRRRERLTELLAALFDYWRDDLARLDLSAGGLEPRQESMPGQSPTAVKLG